MNPFFRISSPCGQVVPQDHPGRSRWGLAVGVLLGVATLGACQEDAPTGTTPPHPDPTPIADPTPKPPDPPETPKTWRDFDRRGAMVASWKKHKEAQREGGSRGYGGGPQAMPPPPMPTHAPAPVGSLGGLGTTGRGDSGSGSVGGGIGGGSGAAKAKGSGAGTETTRPPAGRAARGDSSPAEAAPAAADSSAGAERRTKPDGPKPPAKPPPPTQPRANVEERAARDDAERSKGEHQRLREEADAAAKAEPKTPATDESRQLWLSNDDSMSLASAQRIEAAIRKGWPIPLEHLRPHEWLNFYRFPATPPTDGETFGVRAVFGPGPAEGKATLAINVMGRELTRETRRTATLTLVVDRSGSMNAEGRMTYCKRALKIMYDQLKEGDLVNIVAFDHNVYDVLLNFVVGRDERADYEAAVDWLRPAGSTDLTKGIMRGYEVANEYYSAKTNNRLVILTDALLNTGDLRPATAATIAKQWDEKRIAVSGVGVGSEFRDDILDKITEAGRGAFVFLGSDAVVDRVFGEEFVSLLETVARDVRFQVRWPAPLEMERFHGEQASTVKEEVDPIHYQAGTRQLFLQDFLVPGGLSAVPDEAEFRFRVEWTDPLNDAAQQREFAFRAGEIRATAQDPTLRKARMVTILTDTIRDTARLARGSGEWTAAQACHKARDRMVALEAEGLDGESQVILGLFGRYCARFFANAPAFSSDADAAEWVRDMPKIDVKPAEKQK